MSNKLYEENDVQAIANAIRTKNGSSDTYMVSEMAQAVLDIPQGTTPTGTKQVTISSAGTTTENVSSYANCEITVPQGQYKPNIDATPTNPSITVSNGGLITAEVQTQYVNDLLKPTFTEGYIESSDVSMKVKIGGSATRQLNTVNGQTVTPTTSQQSIAVQGDYVLGAINVAPIPSQYIIPTGTKQITANGTGIDVTQYASVDVSVSGGGGSSVLSGTYTPTENILKPTIDAGGTFDHFVLFSPTATTGNGVKAIRGFMVSFGSGSNNGTNNFGVTTNNSGSSNAVFLESSNGGNIIFQRSGTQFIVANNWATGTGGYFLGGHTYQWYAWSD